ncbi:MAG: hypothetical protein ABIX46_10335 [Burkholderiaceae bacterium]
MTQQIARLSPHQNAKVIAVLMAVGSLVLLVPVFLLVSTFAPAGQRPPMAMMLVMPLGYLVIMYVTVVIGCAVYNALYGYIGGIEFDTAEPNVASRATGPAVR